MIKIKKAKSFKEKLIGFIGEKNINYGILFYNCKSIHTFFMHKSIDIIGLNNKMQVVEIHPNIRPNQILFLKKSNHTLELPNGYAKEYRINDNIRI